MSSPPAGLAGAPDFDLQSHSVHSDGTLAPSVVVELAAAAGVKLFALSDHDTVEGVEEAVVAARRAQVRLVPAVEISAISGEGDLHVLGYLIDYHDVGLREQLERFRADRARRAQAMAEALQELGFELEQGVLETRRRAGRTIGRPHLAGAVLAHPANAERLADERLTEPGAFLETYLVEGAAAFRPRLAPSPAGAIDAIHAAGGLAVWAHPFFSPVPGDAVLDEIDQLRAHGLDGVECFYPTHAREQTEQLAHRCAVLGLLSTGSSDFHGPDHGLFSRFRAFSTYGIEPVLGPIGSWESAAGPLRG